MKESCMVRSSYPPWPRVMRRHTVRVRRGGDRGCAGQVLNSENTTSDCRLRGQVGKATRSIALQRVIHRIRGVVASEHVHKLLARKPGDPGGNRCSPNIRCGRRGSVAKRPTCTLPGSRMG